MSKAASIEVVHHYPFSFDLSGQHDGFSLAEAEVGKEGFYSLPIAHLPDGQPGLTRKVDRLGRFIWLGVDLVQDCLRSIDHVRSALE
jgi:hypothetical protein